MSTQAKVLVTASATGIGATVARQAAAQGYDVYISDIDERRGNALADEISATFLECDLASEESIVKLARAVGCVDLLVNNGGIAGPTAPIEDTSVADWHHVLNVNLTAQFIACREMVPQMKENGGGCIVNMSSVAGKIGYPNRASYAASKWAIRGLSASLAQELGPWGVRVNAVLPGAVSGNRITHTIERYAAVNRISVAEAEASYLAHHAIRRFVEADEVAATVLFLASEAGRSITGQSISVDGGYQ